MTMYYKDGFYPTDQAPEGAVELDEQTYIALLEGQSQGLQIISNEQGYPILIDPKPSPYHELQGTDWVINPEKQAAHQAQKFAKIREDINRLRDEKINGGVWVEAVGKWIDTDATAERNILSVKATFDLMGDKVEAIAWTCADNSILMLGKAELMAIWQTLMQAKTGNHANALKHKAALDEAENPEDYDYSTGWTQTYAEFLEESSNV
ncbi:phage tail protein [Pasteurellaceae bacterium RH1A]|nr:phage tail protein [Pasteurellaceae bacterium RH1A]